MTTYIKGLDGLRGIAIILVMLFHFRRYDFGEIGIDVGWIGVQMFFVLSGFLITRILLNEKQKSISEYLKRFYWRRSLRIFPLYFAYLIVLSISFWLLGLPQAMGKKAVWLYTYTYNFTRLLPEWSHSVFFTHLWSLSVEEQFYLIWPLLIFFTRDKVLKYILAGIIVTSPFIRWGFASFLLTNTSLNLEAAGEAVYWFTFSHLDAFAFGGAIPIFNLHEKVQRPGLLCLIFATVILSIGSFRLAQEPVISPIHFSSLGYPIASLDYGQHIWSYTLLNAFFALLILWVSYSSGGKLFSNSFLVSIGKVSYGMYLFHWGILGAFSKIANQLPISSLLSFVIYFFGVYLFARASFYFFETYFLKIKNNVKL